MRKIFALQFIIIVLVMNFTSCKKNATNHLINNENALKQDRADGTTEPYLSGTFVDFWYKQDWSLADWNSFMKEMQGVGVDKVIVQFTAFDNYIWCDSPNNYSTQKDDKALERLLQAAESYDIDVYIGLYNDNDFWNYTQDENKLKEYAQKNIDLANDIWTNYSHFTSFYGWYISQETAPYYYQDDSAFDKLKDNLINPVADFCYDLSGLPTSISIFFNQNLSTSNDLLYFANRMGATNVDIIMLQDGTGVWDPASNAPHCSYNNLQSYYNDAKWGLFGEQPIFGGDLWAISETFNTNSSPETFYNVKYKFEIVDDFVSEIITFQYYIDMATNTPHSGENKKRADRLRVEYKDYYENW